MKKASLLFLLVCIQSVLPAQEIRRNIVKINPLSVVLGRLTLSYERQVKPGISFEIDTYHQGLLLTRKIRGGGTGKTTYGAAHIGGQLRYYYREKRNFPQGPYLALYGEYNAVTLDETISTPTVTASGSTSGNVYGLGIVIGRQWLLWKRWTIDLYGGGGLYQNDIAPLILHYSDGNDRVDLFPKLLFNPLNAGFSIGYCF